ncbi:MAG: hypothetical protein JWM80_5712 [Cyanobacteria bacterium RYN_339]|nr:hypothetical protein [Cyanobacteria bacterium RYN_339]
MKQNQQFTIALVAGAIALGGYMYFVESKKETPTDSKDVEVWSLSDAAAKDLNTLYIKDVNKEATYTRSGETWTKSDEPTRQVDKAQFDGAYNPLKTLTASRKVEDRPSDKAKYGFAQPQTVVRWGAADSKYALEVGDKNPTGDGYYVHVLKDDGVYTIASYKVEAWKNLAQKPPLVALPSPSPTAAAATGASGAATPAAVPATTVPAASAKPVAPVKPVTPPTTAPAKPVATATPAPATAAPTTAPSPVASK